MALRFSHKQAIVIGIALGAAIFMAAGYYPVAQWFPRTEQVVQAVAYELPAGQEWSKRQWERFLSQEAQQLSNLAPEELKPSLKIHFPQKSPQGGWIQITVQRTMDTKEQLSQWMNCYQDLWQKQPKSEGVRSGQWPQEKNGPWTPAQDWLRQQQKQHDEQQQRLSKLDQEYQQLAVESVDIDRRLAQKDLPVRDQEFERFIAKALDPIYREDRALSRLTDNLQERRSMLAELDTKAGGSTAEETLEHLDRQRQRCHADISKLQEAIEVRQAELKDDVRQEQWPAYHRHLETLREQTWDHMACNATHRAVLAKDLQRTKENVAFILKNIPEFQNSQRPATDEATSVTAPLNARLCTPLIPPEYQSSAPLQFYGTIVLLSLFGGLAGGWVGAGYSGARSKSSYSLTEAITKMPEGAIIPVANPATVQDIPLPLVEAMTESESPRISEVMVEALPPTTAPVREKEMDPARIIETLRQEIPCPVVLVGALDAEEASPRWVVNLAIQLARCSLRILLVEADGFTNDLMTIFELKDGRGFHDWRRGDAWLSQTAQETQLPGLTVMGLGSLPADPSSLSGDLNKELHRWDNLRGRFEVILLYSPLALKATPENPQEVWAYQLPDLADGVFCLYRQKKKAEIVIAAVSNRLQGHKARLLGCPHLPG